MAAHGIASITRIAGDNTGTFRDDLTTGTPFPTLRRLLLL